MNIPDLPKGLDVATEAFFRALKETVDELAGNKKAVKKAMTYQDAINLGLINSVNKRLDDSGDPI